MSRRELCANCHHPLASGGDSAACTECGAADTLAGMAPGAVARLRCAVTLLAWTIAVSVIVWMLPGYASVGKEVVRTPESPEMWLLLVTGTVAFFAIRRIEESLCSLRERTRILGIGLLLVIAFIAAEAHDSAMQLVYNVTLSQRMMVSTLPRLLELVASVMCIAWICCVAGSLGVCAHRSGFHLQAGQLRRWAWPVGILCMLLSGLGAFGNEIHEFVSLRVFNTGDTVTDSQAKIVNGLSSLLTLSASLLKCTVGLSAAYMLAVALHIRARLIRE